MDLKNTTRVLLLFLLAAAGVFGDTAPETPYVANTNLSRAGWDAEGWRIIKRSPSNYSTNYPYDHGERDEACDFTIFQADDGTWQSIGCVRETTFSGFTRLLYRWETTNFFSSDWTEVGVLLTTDDGPDGIGYSVGTLQAPHVVKDGDLYYMIYNSRNAHLMVSTNGKDWAHQTNSAGGYTLFNMNSGRDVMLMDNRDVDGRWYAAYCGKSDWHGTNNIVYYHSATNILGPWSEPIAMARQDHWRHAESPFLFRRGGWFYLVLQDEVFAQPSVTNYFGYPIFTDLGTYGEGSPLGSPIRGYAPEVIHHPNGQDYIAAYNNGGDEPWGGTEIRPLYWKWTDTDGDGLPNWWENTYYGGDTNANPGAMASNGVNTVIEAYIAGLDPTDPSASFEISNFAAGGPIVYWSGVSGRVYTVYWTSNLLNGFQPLETNLPWTGSVFTDTTHSAEQKGFYKIEVELE